MPAACWRGSRLNGDIVACVLHVLQLDSDLLARLIPGSRARREGAGGGAAGCRVVLFLRRRSVLGDAAAAGGADGGTGGHGAESELRADCLLRPGLPAACALRERPRNLHTHRARRGGGHLRLVDSSFDARGIDTLDLHTEKFVGPLCALYESR